MWQRLLPAAVLAAATAVFGCGGGVRPTTILPDGVELRAGDVVLRRGGGMASRAVLVADGGDYSHVGIVVDSAGVMMVVHAVPGEPDYDGDPDRGKMEPAAEYFDGGRASSGCVLRCARDSVARRAAAKAVEVYRRGTLFDHDYDAADTVRMYCCELVEAAYLSAGVSVAPGPRHDVSLPGLSFRDVILPSDFCRSPVLRLVAAF